MPATIEHGTEVSLSSLAPGAAIVVETRNHSYRIEHRTGHEMLISGHPTICPTPVPAQLLGSAFKNGPVEGDFIRTGMHLVFRLADGATVTTGEIQDVRLEFG